MHSNLIEKIILYLLFLLPLSIIVGITVSTIFILGICIFFLIFSYKNNYWEWVKEKNIKLLFFLYFYLILNSIISENPSLGILRNLGFLRYIIFIAAIQYVLNSKDKQKYIKLLANYWTIILSIVCIDVYFEFFFKQNLLGFKSYDPIRIASFFKDELVVGAYLNAFFLLVISFFIYGKNYFPKKIFYLEKIIPIIFIIAILLTGERANFIRSFFGLLFLIFIFAEINLRKKIIIFVLMLLISTLVINIAPKHEGSSSVTGRFLQMYAQINTIEKIKSLPKNNIYFRHYKAAIEIFKKYPIFGVGNKNFGRVCHKNDNWNKILKEKGACSTHPHNVWFEFLAEHGLIGSLIFLGIIFFILIENLKIFFKNNNYIHLSSTLYLFLVFFPLLPGGSFFNNFNSTLFWINFAIMISFSKASGGHDKN